MAKTIGIIGTRKRDGKEDYKRVEWLFLSIYEQGDWLVSGHCKEGGDRFAEAIAFKFGVPILLFPARWRDYFRASARGPAASAPPLDQGMLVNDSVYDSKAGFKRNVWIAEQSDILIAVVSPEGRFAGGTGNTIHEFLSMKPNNKVYFV